MLMRFAALLLALCGLAGAVDTHAGLVVVSRAPLQNAGWQLVWSDEFNGSGALSSTDGDYEGGFIRNEEAQYHQSGTSNATQTGGSLVIEARVESVGGGSYTSASVITKNKRTFLYGRIEVRAKLPVGNGTWPAIWLQGTSGSWPARGEIDIMEYVGFESNLTHTNVFTTNFTAGQYGGTHAVSDVTAWHDYALEWFTDRLDYYIDGVKVNTFPKLSSNAADWPFDSPQYLLLNLAIGGAWGGQQGINNALFPHQYEIDYVRYYQ